MADDASLHATTQLTVRPASSHRFQSQLQRILGKRADYLSDSSYTLFVWNNFDVNYHLYADIGNDCFNGSQSFTTNTWYHVALVFDGSLAAAQRVRLYVNGVLDGEFNESATSVPVFQTSVHVGCIRRGRRRFRRRSSSARSTTSPSGRGRSASRRSCGSRSR